MKIAKTVAAGSTGGRFRLGAVLVRGKSVIRKATNQEKTHPFKIRHHPDRAYKGLHAEVAALRGLRPYDVAGADLYVFRLKADGSSGLSKPCPVCMWFLTDMKIDRVYYSLNSGGVGYLKL
jgi:tRNA(Arg) A34 adenosine deaminase TadA